MGLDIDSGLEYADKIGDIYGKFKSGKKGNKGRVPHTELQPTQASPEPGTKTLDFSATTLFGVPVTTVVIVAVLGFLLLRKK